MSMLRSFFEIGTDKSLFDGLYISQDKSLCDEHMRKYSFFFISFKDVEGLSYDEAFQVFSRIIGNEISKFSFLAESDKLTVLEKEQFKGLLHIEKGKFIFDKDTFTASLKLLSQLLYKHYGQKVVILIDEYDVPLDKAYQNGYYHEMVSLIRGLFGQALKTNDYLQFAILTGCLRISKESIFTGLNNFEVVSTMDSMYDECFGFTDKEVQEILKFLIFQSIMQIYGMNGTTAIISATPISTARGCHKILQEPVCRSHCKAAGLLVKFKRKCSGQKLH